MKLFIKLIIFIVVLAVAAPFIMKRPDGGPLLSISDLSGDSAILKSFKMLTGLFGSGKGSISEGDSLEGGPLLTTVHKWKDDEGLWHFSDEQPESLASEKLEINPNQNILEMNGADLLTKLEEKEGASKSPESLMPPEGMIPGIPTIDQAKKAMDNAKAVQGLLDNHYKQLEGI